MSEPWAKLERDALSNEGLFSSLDWGDQQLLRSFGTFAPKLHVDRHCILRMSEDITSRTLRILGSAGGVWWSPGGAPFDESGHLSYSSRIDSDAELQLFKRWSLPLNQTVVARFASERYDDHAFSAIISTDTEATTLRRIKTLDPFKYFECLHVFFDLINELKWTIVVLRPTGMYGALVVAPGQEHLIARVASCLIASPRDLFVLRESGGRFDWDGPTEWD